MHNTNALYNALNDQLHTINRQIEVTTADLLQQINKSPWARDAKPEEMKDTAGNFVLTPLLVAKAQILSGMAALKAADVTSKAPQPRRR